MTDPSRSASGAGSACPDVDTLADYQAGVLDEQTAAEIAAHVAADPRCQQVLAALDATVAQLRSMPPVTMPDDVVQRIHAALAAEAGRGRASGLRVVPSPARTESSPQPIATAGDGQRTAPSHLPPRESGDNVTDLSAARAKRGGRAKMWLAAAAAAVVVGGGTALIATQSGGGSDNNVAEQSSQGDAQGEDPAPGGDVLAFGSPSDVLDKGAITDDKVSPDIAGEMADRSARNQCLSAIPGRPLEAPEAVQKGEHGGQEAYAFIFPTDDPDEIQMIVVSASDCSVVLDEQTGPR